MPAIEPKMEENALAANYFLKLQFVTLQIHKSNIQGEKISETILTRIANDHKKLVWEHTKLTLPDRQIYILAHYTACQSDEHDTD